jgi:hypothetical protein
MRGVRQRSKTAPERLIAILPLLEFFRQRRAGCTVTVRCSDGSKPRTSNDLVADIAAQHGISPKTAWAWFSAYEGGRYAGLARRRRSDAYFSRQPRAAKLLADLLRKKRSARAIYETLQHALPAPAPCYSTVRVEVRRLRAQRRATRRRGGSHA